MIQSGQNANPLAAKIATRKIRIAKRITLVLVGGGHVTQPGFWMCFPGLRHAKYGIMKLTRNLDPPAPSYAVVAMDRRVMVLARTSRSSAERLSAGRAWSSR